MKNCHDEIEHSNTNNIVERDQNAGLNGSELEDVLYMQSPVLQTF